MVAINLDSLITQFTDWSFKHDEASNAIHITTRVANKLPESLEVIKAVESLLSEKGYTISISSLPMGIHLIVKNNKTSKKYVKMYTSGCFDILHHGHLNILKRSKEMCDHLLVGVSTDELIEKEKGKRPVIPFEERIRLVEALKYVDEVIPQVDKNKQRVIDEHQIDAISVGDDWKGRFPATSCPVEYFSYTPSVSSTILKDTLKL